MVTVDLIRLKSLDIYFDAAPTMTINPYEPPSTPPSDNKTPRQNDVYRSSLATPTLAYTADGNLEAHSVVTWLQSNGVRAYAVEDNSGVSLFAFGTISQFHKPQVFVDQCDLNSAGELLRQFEAQRDRRRTKFDDSPPIDSECEECGVTSEFPAAQNGTTQNCPKCNSYMDVGSFDWPDDFDYGGDDDSQMVELSADDALDDASMLEKAGDWRDAIAAYQAIADRWPDHANYASNCIAIIQRKIDTAYGR